MIDADNLTDKQLKFIELYFKEPDINTICKKLNITRPTYYNYLKDEDVKDAINKMRVDILQNTSIYLQDNLKTCSNKLMDIINDDKTSPQVKINAINSVFNNCHKLTEQVDILTRLDEIEGRLSKEQEDTNNR